MDMIWATMIVGFVLIVLALLWNKLVAPKNKQQQVNSLLQHFIDRYGFSKNEDGTLVSGVYKNRTIQLTLDPLEITIQVQNPKSIHLIVEKGITTPVMDLVETPIDGATGLSIKSNFPQLASMMFDDKLVLDCKVLDSFSFQLEEGLRVRFPVTSQAPDVEKVLKVAIALANAVEQVNYAYS